MNEQEKQEFIPQTLDEFNLKLLMDNLAQFVSILNQRLSNIEANVIVKDENGNDISLYERYNRGFQMVKEQQEKENEVTERADA